MKPELDLPAALIPFKDKILASAKAYIAIIPEPATETNWWQSKIGGLPYLPKDSSYPSEADGRPLFLLAQLNFEEIPTRYPFPTKGILQFFIADNEVYGLDFEDATNQEKFSVRYYMDIETDIELLQTDFSFLPEIEVFPINPKISYPLTFKRKEEYVPIIDTSFKKQLGIDFFAQFGKEEWDLQEKYNQLINSSGHKIGGYGYFTQEDPRNAEESLLLLFQLDSDERIASSWGDMGVANFFISEADLKNENFSNVIYNWDCY